MSSFYRWCDKARGFIHRIAPRFDERDGLLPDSLMHQAKARDSLKLELPLKDPPIFQIKKAF